MSTGGPSNGLMVVFKDFTAARDGWFAAHTSIDEVIQTLNEWLADNPVDVINIETLFAGKRTSFQGIRAWYRIGPAQAENPPA